MQNEATMMQAIRLGLHTAAAVVTLSISAVSCGTKTPDYQLILSKSSTTTTTTPDKPIPLPQYLESIGVTGQQVAPSSLPGLTVSIPTPPGWSPYSNPNITPETLIIAKSGKYPTARIVAFKLRGDFDPTQVIKHGNDDAQLFENFRQLDVSTANYNGFPSAMIQGSYDLEGRRLHAWNRIVIPTGPPPSKQQYLVQLTITSLANEAVAQSNDIEAIIRGFVVAPK